ncbi:thiamine pyrophosphate-dependent enzyme [Desulforhopalus singaporensis]|uniref:Uncharacterized protein n=1 Tax=Desulforhopalus singaporensis TaxID=91360 RepID=A0A1H0URX6_9BACT|nr:hypothetical protein [Desulforhopalus singaporensis]SDP68880.1 hypothetical protein SAMN05660330_03694 [Desulforhopalus singaporensis]
MKKSILSRLDQWNPVSIRPDNGTMDGAGIVLNQKRGYVCSVDRGQNLLTKVIETSLDTDLLRAGDESCFSVIPSQIFKGNSQTPVVHHLVLSTRSFATVDEVRSQLDGIIYKEMKDFSVSQGMNFDPAFSDHSLCKMTVIVCKCESGNISVPVIELDAPVIKHRLVQEVRKHSV